MLAPVRGRSVETLALLPRLFSTAGMPFTLCVIVDGDTELAQQLSGARKSFPVLVNETREGYWHCLRRAAQETHGEFLVNLANDLLPGASWLKRALDAYRSTFGDGEGLIGFNDGVHFGEHAAHFLVKRTLLQRWYGADYFPVMYAHSHGDVEISVRAQEEGKFAVANFAILYHNHYFNGRKDDAVYAEGRERIDEDRLLFRHRLEHRWKAASVRQAQDV